MPIGLTFLKNVDNVVVVDVAVVAAVVDVAYVLDVADVLDVHEREVVGGASFLDNKGFFTKNFPTSFFHF